MTFPSTEGFVLTRKTCSRPGLHATPDEEMITKVHNLLYNSFPQEVINEITYRCYLDYGFWLDKDAPNIFLTAKNCGDKRPKACSIHNMAVTTAREYVRNRFGKRLSIPHGIVLTISKHKTTSSLSRLNRKQLCRRRKNEGFDFARFVKGWRSPVHVQYCKERNYMIPLLPGLDDEVMDTEVTEATAIEFGSPSSNESPNSGIDRAVELFQKNDKRPPLAPVWILF